jgi:hypothetical protein
MIRTRSPLLQLYGSIAPSAAALAATRSRWVDRPRGQRLPLGRCERHPGGPRHRQKHQGVACQRISAGDLQRLPEADLRHIKVLEQSMEKHYAIWAAVYPQLALAIDPIATTKTEQQLKGIIIAMKGDLIGILNFLRQAGLDLDDHYRSIRDVVARA